MSNEEMLGPPREVLDYYDRFPEESRLATGPFKLEFERTLTRPIASIAVGDARSLAEPDGSAAVAMIMGPLYHLAGFSEVDVIGVEGVAWMFADFESRWADEALRQDILNVARALEAEPSIVGVSAHLLGIGRKL
jgi:hypothetical protein